jgi:hypothetical protein
MWASQLFYLRVLEQLLCTSLPYSFCWFIFCYVYCCRECFCLGRKFVIWRSAITVVHRLCIIRVCFLFVMAWNKKFLYRHCVTICHYKGSGNPGGAKIRWYTSASGLCWWCKSIGRWCKYYKKIIEALIDSSKEVGLEVNTEKTKYMLMFRHQNGEQNFNVKIANKSLENLAQYKHFWTTVKNQISIHGEIKSRLILCNASYHLVQDLLSSCPLFKNMQIRSHKTIISSAVLYGCETWSVTLKDVHRLRVRSESFWLRYINRNIAFLDMIHLPVLFKIHNISETGFCLLLQEKTYSVFCLVMTSILIILWLYRHWPLNNAWTC